MRQPLLWPNFPVRLSPSMARFPGGADIHTTNAVTNIQGNLVLDHASVHGAAIGIPIRMDYNIANDLRSDVLEAQSARITAGSVVINSTGRLDSKANTINATAQTTNANITELLALAKVLGAANASGSGTLSLNATFSGPLKGSLNCSGSASIPDARIISSSSSGPLTIHNARMQFNGSTANISAMSGAASGGLALANLQNERAAFKSRRGHAFAF